jgi:hypothetical protein
LSGLIIVGVVAGLWVMFGLYGFLAQNDRIEAEVLVVEGWLPTYALDQAYEEYKKHNYKKIITTGGPVDTKFRMYANGMLHINIPDSVVTKAPAASNIVIQAQGTYADGAYPHFTVWVNDTICVGESYTYYYPEKHYFPLEPETPAIHKVHIHYDNDASKDGNDRDLYFRSLSITNYETDYLTGSVVYEHYSPKAKQMIKFSDKTMAEMAASYLKGIGLSGKEVVAMPSPPVARHRTYTSAIALREWLIKNQINSINIFSMATHARRSRLSYEKVLRDADNIEVGIIAVATKEYTSRNWWRKRRSAEMVMREAMKYTYIQFFFDLV